MNMIIAVFAALQWLTIYDLSEDFSDLAGITIVNGNIISVDSEVNETTLFDRPNLLEMTTTGVVRSTMSLQSFTKEPTGIAYDEASKTFYISDDSRRGMLHTMQAGQDRLFGTDDDVITSTKMATLGIPSKDIEGVAVLNGRVYLAAGIDALIYVLEDGLLVDILNAAPMTDVEGLTTDGERLYAVGSPHKAIFSFDLNGSYLGTQRIPYGRIGGIAYSNGLFYLAHRGVDNGPDPDESDGMVFVIEAQ